MKKSLKKYVPIENQYKITPEEREMLEKRKIGVIGLSVGQSVSITLAMETELWGTAYCRLRCIRAQQPEPDSYGHSQSWNPKDSFR